MSSATLAERYVAVLGGSSGIGLATARLVIARGARVTIGGRDPARLARAYEALGEEAYAVAVDATDAEPLRRFSGRRV